MHMPSSSRISLYRASWVLLVCTFIGAATTLFVGKRYIALRRQESTNKELAQTELKPPPSGIAVTFSANTNTVSRDLTVNIGTQFEEDIQALSIKNWILLGYERAKLEKALASKQMSLSEYRQRKESLRGKEAVILLQYPDSDKSLAVYGFGTPSSADQFSTAAAPAQTPVIEFTSSDAPQPLEVTVDTSKSQSPLPQSPSTSGLWIAACATLITAIATISAGMLGWRADRRAAKELSLKLAEAEQKRSEVMRNEQEASPDGSIPFPSKSAATQA
jgi:hypothetical protein